MNIDITKLFDPAIARENKAYDLWFDFVLQEKRLTLNHSSDNLAWLRTISLFKTFQFKHYDASTIIQDAFLKKLNLSKKEFYELFECIAERERPKYQSENFLKAFYAHPDKKVRLYRDDIKTEQELKLFIQYHFDIPPVPDGMHPMEHLMQHVSHIHSEDIQLLEGIVTLVPYHVLVSPKFQSIPWKKTLFKTTFKHIYKIHAELECELSYLLEYKNNIKEMNMYLNLAIRSKYDVTTVFDIDLQHMALEQWKQGYLNDEHITHYFLACPLSLWNVEAMPERIFELLSVDKTTVKTMSALLEDGYVSDLKTNTLITRDEITLHI